MVQKSFTRVTLALDIVKKIEDGPFKGFHELSIIKHQISLHDIINIIPSDSLQIECDNPLVPCDDRNICWKAVKLINSECGINENVKINIKKNIPVMGGLAGGSANAATVLMMLNKLWNLNLNEEKLKNLGRKLGMDVPFYFEGKTAFDSEATSYLYRIPSSLHLVFVLAIPDFGVSTAEAYKGIDYSETGKNKELTRSMIDSFRSNNRVGVLNAMHNDFEPVLFRIYPEIENVKKQLISAGCERAVVSGSGSTVLGVAKDIDTARKIYSNMNCRTIISESLNSCNQTFSKADN